MGKTMGAEAQRRAIDNTVHSPLCSPRLCVWKDEISRFDHESRTKVVHIFPRLKDKVPITLQVSWAAPPLLKFKCLDSLISSFL